MTIACPGCGSEIDADMNFCPYCGRDTGGVPHPAAAPALPATAVPSYAAGPQMAGYPGVYPVYPMPYPYYAPPPSGGRILAIVGAVILIIDGILAGMMGLILVWIEEDVAIGVALIVGCALAITSSISVFIAKLPILSLLGPFSLIAAGLMVAGPFDVPEIGLIGMFLAVLALVFILVGFKDLRARAEMRERMPAFVPPYVAPPPYGGGPGPGARPPGL